MNFDHRASMDLRDWGLGVNVWVTAGVWNLGIQLGPIYFALWWL